MSSSRCNTRADALARATFESGGHHELATDDERGMSVRVVGFGYALSYYYPAGADLKLISEPPVIVP